MFLDFPFQFFGRLALQSGVSLQKKIMKPLLIFLTCITSVNLQAQEKNNLQVSFNRNVEFLGLTFFMGLLGEQYANSSDRYDDGTLKKDWHAHNLVIYKTYSGFKTEASLQTIASALSQYQGSSLLKLVLSLNDFPNAKLEPTVNPDLYLFFDRQNASAAKTKAEVFLNALNDFYQITNFDQYFLLYQKHYDQALKEITQCLPHPRFINEMETFYRAAFQQYQLIPSLTIPCGMGFATSKVEKNGTAIFSAFGCTSLQDLSDAEVLHMGFEDCARMFELTVHEFGHSFIHHSLQQMPLDLIKKTEKLFDPIRLAMEDQGYTTWYATFDEHLVRAGEVIILRNLGLKEQAQKLYDTYKFKKNYIYIDQVLEELTWYDQHKNENYDDMIHKILTKLATTADSFTYNTGITDSLSAKIHTEDINLFWKVFDQTYPNIKASALETEYLEKGSKGLKAFITNRIKSGKNLRKVVMSEMDYYQSIRESTLSIEAKRSLIADHFKKFRELYPEATLPEVYFVIGAKNTGGMAFRNGLSIGAEMFGNPNNKITPRLDLELIDDVVVHELMHFQQKYVSDNSLLAQSIREGSADFLCELITGKHANQDIYKYGDAHERELWNEFKLRMHKADWSGWLYYQRDKSRPKDLGYWMGSKITKAYYDKAADKRQAITDILTIQDFKKFLADSGYVGGVD